VPLQCLRCQTPIPAGLDELAWVCENCQQGQRLDPQNGLEAVEVYYSAALAPEAVGKPYWVADGRVWLSRRETYGSDRQEAQAFWSQPRRFFVPAFAANLDSLLAQAGNLLLQPPALQAGRPARFEPVTLALEDVRSAVEFIVIAAEAARKDRLKTLEFKLDLGQPVLWILP
jgi:hypothetical protein